MDEKNTLFFVDAHQDMAWNMLTLGRDYTLTQKEIHKSEVGTGKSEFNGDSLLGWDVYQRGNIGLVFATLFAAPIRRKSGELDTLTYKDFDEAHKLYLNQLDTYHQLVDEHPDKFILIRTKLELNDHLEKWENRSSASELPVGLVILMEGAEGVRDVSELEMWREQGVRMVGLAWAGTRYCGGTNDPGPLTKDGYQLLEAMSDLGITLDISHMDEIAALQALDSFEGRIIASHANALALLKDCDINRFLSDEVIERLIEREGVIGIVPLNKFLDWSVQKGDPREKVGIHTIADQIDHVCQIAGNAKHVGIGSDSDGGFGVQSVPFEMQSAADIHLVAEILKERGYDDDELAGIFGGNWIEFLKDILD